MSKNLNNNYSSSDSTTNLQIVSLQSSLSTLQSSLTSLTSSVSTVQSYTATDSSTINAAITSNNTLYVLPLFNTYLTTVLGTSLINSLISTNNTVYIANLLSSTLTSQNTLRDTAISSAITSAKGTFLSSINTYSANQVFTSLTTGTINYIGSFNSVQIGVGCNAGVSSVSIGGNGGLTNSSGVSVGCNSMISNSGICNTCVGSNALVNNTTGKNLCSFGEGNGSAQTIGHNNCYIGAQTNCTAGGWSNSCAIGYGALITGSNMIQLGSSSEIVYCTKLSMPTNQILTYSTIPSTVSNQVGYQVSNSRTIAISFISNSYINISLCTLPVGIYIVNYSMNLYSISTTSGLVEKSFIEYGISSTSTSNNIQNRKSYFSVPMGLSHSLTNTICYVSSGLTIFLNATLPSQDLTNNSLSASTFYINNANITATRIA